MLLWSPWESDRLADHSSTLRTAESALRSRQIVACLAASACQKERWWRKSPIARRSTPAAVEIAAPRPTWRPRFRIRWCCGAAAPLLTLLATLVALFAAFVSLRGSFGVTVGDTACPHFAANRLGHRLFRECSDRGIARR